MESIDINVILKRENIELNIKQFIDNFYSAKTFLKRGLYIYGDNNIGKTTFILNLLKKCNYDVIYYDNSIIRNKILIDNICCDNLSNVNVYSLLTNKQKKMVIVIDDIDSMNSGDKSTMVSLIKLIRVKKTKKQKLENLANCPIICINNLNSDKKIIELMKVCEIYKLTSPTNNQLLIIINLLLPNLFRYNEEENNIIKINILNYLNNKLDLLNKIVFYENNNVIFEKFYIKKFNIALKNNNDIKVLTNNFLTNYYPIENTHYILETDRTILALLFHENIISVFNNVFDKNILNIYLSILENYIFCDFIDRVIFQKQIWQLTEINYIIKLFYNNYILNEHKLLKHNNVKLDDIIFTKILTKYSSEYNNYIFIYNLLQIFFIEKKDIFTLILKYYVNDNIIKNVNEYNNYIDSTYCIDYSEYNEYNECNEYNEYNEYKYIDSYEPNKQKIDVNIILDKLKNYNISKLEITRIIKFITQLMDYH
jgi:hypothetical protein